MIDWISALIPLDHYKIISDGTVINSTEDGEIVWETLKRKPIEGSYSSKVSIISDKKTSLNDGSGKVKLLYLHVSGNPIKFLQGHNAFGSGDLLGLVYDMMIKICNCLDIKPTPHNLNAWRIGAYTLTRVDCTDMIDLQLNDAVNSYLYRLGTTGTYKHRGNATTSGGTVYFGQKSTYYAIKFYNKSEEIKKHKIPDTLPTKKSITNWVEGKLRVELVLRSRELKRQGLNIAGNWDSDYKEIDLLEKYCSSDKLKMTEKNGIDEELLISLPKGLRNTYIIWAGGLDPKALVSRKTFYRHRKDLLDYGIDISSPKPKESKDNIVEFKKTIEIPWVFGNNHPDWAEETGAFYRPNHLSSVK